MAKRRDLEAAVKAAEDGDAIASAALHDMAEEDGLPPFWKPSRGEWVVIYTGAFFHVGQLLGEDHECYGLAANSATIFETGDFATFYGEGKATSCEVCPEVSIVRKGPTVQVTRWPFTRRPETT